MGVEYKGGRWEPLIVPTDPKSLPNSGASIEIVVPSIGVGAFLTPVPFQLRDNGVADVDLSAGGIVNAGVHIKSPYEDGKELKCLVGAGVRSMQSCWFALASRSAGGSRVETFRKTSPKSRWVTPSAPSRKRHLPVEEAVRAPLPNRPPIRSPQVPAATANSVVRRRFELGYAPRHRSFVVPTAQLPRSRSRKHWGECGLRLSTLGEGPLADERGRSQSSANPRGTAENFIVIISRCPAKDLGVALRTHV